jgi:hypothetical protein
MTDTEAKWAARVDAWRASGETAPTFCKGKGFSPGGLRYWSSQLTKNGTQPADGEVRLARVVRKAAVPELETAIVIEVGGAQVGVRRGFDAAALRSVLEILGARR